MYDMPFMYPFDAFKDIMKYMVESQGKQYISLGATRIIVEWFKLQWEKNDPQYKFINETQTKIWKILCNAIEEQYPASAMNKKLNSKKLSKNVRRLDAYCSNYTYDLHDNEKKWNNRQLFKLLDGFNFPTKDQMPLIGYTNDRTYSKIHLNLENIKDDIINLYEFLEIRHNRVNNFTKSVYDMLKDYYSLDDLYIDFPELKNIDLGSVKRKERLEKIRLLITPVKKE